MSISHTSTSTSLILKFYLFILMNILLLYFVCSGNSKSNFPQGPYQANWESLNKFNQAPEWFLDAKFGIYFHWGVYSVPPFGSEWYPRNMHIKNMREYKHHLEKYGNPTQFGYHDFVSMFKAKNFDSEEWAELFVRD